MDFGMGGGMPEMPSGGMPGGGMPPSGMGGPPGMSGGMDIQQILMMLIKLLEEQGIDIQSLLGGAGGSDVGQTGYGNY